MPLLSRSLPRFCFILALNLLANLPGSAQEAKENYYRPTIDLKKIEYRADWYGVYLKDEANQRKVGFMRGDRVRLDDGTIRETELMNLKLVSFGQKTEIAIDHLCEYEGQAPYRLTKASYATTTGKIHQKVSVRRVEQGYEFTHDAPGVHQVKVQPDLVYTLEDVLALELWIRQNPKAGETIRFRQLDLSEQKIDVQTSTIRSIKTSLVGGVNVQLFELETLSREKGVKALSRHDSTGLMLSDEVAIFELRLEPEALAKNIEFSQDLFVMGLAKIDRKIGDPRTITDLVLEIDSTSKEAITFESGPRQTISMNDTKGSRQIKLGKQNGQSVKASPKEIADALKETPSYAISHAKVQELSKQAIGDAQTTPEKVKRLVDFVHSYIQPSLSADMPQIDDLIRNKKGDCKSYALMLTNLARAAGIPAREVSGLLYVGDDYQAFGGHAWNEVVIDGVWVPVDAAFGEVEVNATHISFGSENRATANLLNSLGKLSFRVVDVKHSR